MRTAVELRTSDGLTLEGAVDAPSSPRGAVVLCHPHPKMGGTMEAPLLLALSDRLVAGGWAVVRFNFRGIGASEGVPGTGTEELADARAALDESRARFAGLPLGLAGWSFGAAVALRAAVEAPDVRACVAIAPAFRPIPGVTDGVPEGPGPHMPTLVVVAANDERVPGDAARDWVGSTPGAELVEIAGANHFFWARYDRLAEVVAGFLEQVVAVPAVDVGGEDAGASGPGRQEQ